MNIIGKLICKITGKHKRGQRIKGNDGCSVIPDGHALYRCPRCNTEWTRKVKAV